MNLQRNATENYGGTTTDRRRAGIAVVLALTTTALLLASGGTALAQEGKARAVQEAKLGLGDLIKRANQGVVLINIENRSGQKIGFGSGFLIDDKGLVATNLHVVARAAKANVVFDFKDGNKSAVKCLRAYDKLAKDRPRSWAATSTARASSSAITRARWSSSTSSPTGALTACACIPRNASRPRRWLTNRSPCWE